MRKKIKKPSLSDSQAIESMLNMYMGKVSTVNEDIDTLFIMPDGTFGRCRSIMPLFKSTPLKRTR